MTPKMTERDMLAILCHFLSTKQYVQGDERSIKDMVARYQSPPFSIAFPIVMRLSVQQYNQLNDMLKEAHALLASTEKTSYPSDGMMDALKADYDQNLKGQLSPEAMRLETQDGTGS